MNPHRASILVVDDNQPSRQLVRTLLLNQLGVHSVDEASDGAAALRLMERAHYDVVLADWNMPNLSGIELVRIIRASPAAERPPVVLISCDISPKRSMEAMAAGVSGLVQKPFVNETLCKKVLRIISLVAPVFDVSYAPPSVLVS